MTKYISIEEKRVTDLSYLIEEKYLKQWRIISCCNQ